MHRLLGLGCGLVLAVICGSGIVISYWHELDGWLHPEFPAIQAGPAGPADIDRMLAAARTACPSCGRPREVSADPARAVTHVYFDPAPDEAADEIVLANATAAVVLRRHAAADPITWVYWLHSSLLCGPLGQAVVGVLGLVQAILVLSGFARWWPRRGKWRRALSLRPPAAPLGFLRDLHKAVGALTMPMLVCAGLTGVALAYPDTVTALLHAPGPVPLAAARAASCAGCSPGAVLRTAQSLVPSARWTDIQLPDQAGGATTMVQLRQPGERARYGETRVWINTLSGASAGLRDGLALPPREAARALLVPLHSGVAFGNLVRALFACAAAAVIALALTGLAFFVLRRARAREGSARMIAVGRQ